MLDSKKLAEAIQAGNLPDGDGLTIVPQPNLEELAKSGEASISLRLGRWFLVLKQSSRASFDVTAASPDTTDHASAKRYFVPFGEQFVLHPGRFTLAATLEWMRFPVSLGGYVTGKSTWARRGLITETAAGIHPGFCGCLTLELANVGEVPIIIRPGMRICQIFLHSVPDGKLPSQGPLSGHRRPFLGHPKHDPILEKLRKTGG